MHRRKQLLYSNTSSAPWLKDVSIVLVVEDDEPLPEIVHDVLKRAAST
jgi:hypothetical protein